MDVQTGSPDIVRRHLPGKIRKLLANRERAETRSRFSRLTDDYASLARKLRSYRRQAFRDQAPQDPASQVTTVGTLTR